jgi:hypothetical protein
MVLSSYNVLDGMTALARPTRDHEILKQTDANGSLCELWHHNSTVRATMRWLWTKLCATLHPDWQLATKVWQVVLRDHRNTQGE